MNALRFIEKPVKGKVRLSLPKSFDEGLVEIIVLPVEKGDSRQAHSRLKVAQQYLDQSRKSSFDTGSLDPHEQ